jgi:hypothetical protein
MSVSPPFLETAQQFKGIPMWHNSQGSVGASEQKGRMRFSRLRDFFQLKIFILNLEHCLSRVLYNLFIAFSHRRGAFTFVLPMFCSNAS